jgi:16S rRNA (cytosine1402-N4)-methyltransferase
LAKHISVLKKETIDLLKIKADGVYVDLTLGGGGHSLDIISKLVHGTLIVFDIDKEAIENFAKVLIELGGKKEKDIDESIQKFTQNNSNIYIVNSNFENIKDIIEKLSINRVDGIIADLGWSTDQLDQVPGLSFENEAENLDMRFDRNQNITASDFLNALGKKEMKVMFERYADFFGVQNKTLVEEITKYRKRNKFITVGDLNEFIKYLSGNYIFKSANKNQLKARIFQSLRIAVNNEYNNLKNMLVAAIEILNKESRIEVITFHSGEEKIVQEILGDLVTKKKAIWVSDSKNKLYIQPSLEELKENISSRSSKLWAVEII